MWNHIINIYLSELLNTKTKESKLNQSLKKFVRILLGIKCKLSIFLIIIVKHFFFKIDLV